MRSSTSPILRVLIDTSGVSRRRSARSLTALLVVGAVALSACGSGHGSSSVAKSDDASSAYCRTARGWAVHELSPVDDSDPSALRSYMDEYVAFLDTAARQAPAVLKHQWALTASSFKATALPVMKRYGYDVGRIDAEATPEEQSALNEPPATVSSAQDAIHSYEALECGAGQPAAAKVEFAGPPAAEYCAASNALDGAFNDAVRSPTSAADMRKLVTGRKVVSLMATLEAKAPSEIRDDMVAVDEFTRDKSFPVLEHYGYDVRRLILKGNAEDRAIFQSTDSRIRGHFARLRAYSEQLCATSS